jgi:hypothetical protein
MFVKKIDKLNNQIDKSIFNKRKKVTKNHVIVCVKHTSAFIILMVLIRYPSDNPNIKVTFTTI